MARGHAGSQPDGPDEGFYDARLGAAAYAPIVAAFGALAVTAIVVVFTVGNAASPARIALATGLLVVGVFGSLIGSFGLAAIGAEKDPTANLVPAIMFIAVPVALSIIAILGAFEVLARIYVHKAATLFVFVTGAGGLFAVLLTAFTIGDASSLHPTNLTQSEFDRWRATQWLHDRSAAYRATNIVAVFGVLPPIVGTTLRMSGIRLKLNQWDVNWIVGTAIGLSLIGAVLSLSRTRHPVTGNNQSGLRKWEAWATTLAISVYTLMLILVLP